MFFDEKFNSIHLKKSNILNFIGFLQAMGFSIALFIIPLYLFEIFQSGETIGQINSIAALFAITTTLLLSVLLGRFSRGILFKLSILIIIFALSSFLIFSNFHEALGARGLLMIGGVLTSSILSLYLKDISIRGNENLGKNSGFFGVSKNIAWVIGPIGAGFAFEILKNNKNYFIENFGFLGDGKYFEYQGIIYISIIFIIITITTFLLAKFINNHPHLQATTKTIENNKHHHFNNFKFIGEYFQNKYRTLSFLNIAFSSIWFSVLRGFLFTLLLQDLGTEKQIIGIFFGLMSLPLVLLEGFFGKILKKLGGSLNTLITGYGISIFFFLILPLSGYSNIYLVMLILILSHIGLALIEPLMEYQYMEGTNEDNESKFYSIHRIGGSMFRLIMPALFGIGITFFGIQKIFYFVPLIFGIFFIGLIIYKFKFENK